MIWGLGKFLNFKKKGINNPQSRQFVQSRPGKNNWKKVKKKKNQKKKKSKMKNEKLSSSNGEGERERERELPQRQTFPPLVQGTLPNVCARENLVAFLENVDGVSIRLYPSPKTKKIHYLLSFFPFWIFKFRMKSLACCLIGLILAFCCCRCFAAIMIYCCCYY